MVYNIISSERMKRKNQSSVCHVHASFIWISYKLRLVFEVVFIFKVEMLEYMLAEISRNDILTLSKLSWGQLQRPQRIGL